MADQDENLPKRIEAVFARTGLGNTDPEKLQELTEQHDRAMTTADHIRARKGKNFEEILSIAPEAVPEE